MANRKNSRSSITESHSTRRTIAKGDFRWDVLLISVNSFPTLTNHSYSSLLISRKSIRGFLDTLWADLPLLFRFDWWIEDREDRMSSMSVRDQPVLFLLTITKRTDLHSHFIETQEKQHQMLAVDFTRMTWMMCVSSSSSSSLWTMTSSSVQIDPIEFSGRRQRRR